LLVTECECVGLIEHLETEAEVLFSSMIP